MFRAIAVILLLAAGAVVVLWQLDVIDLPFGSGALGSQDAVPDLLQAAREGDTDNLIAALEAGTPADTRNSEGRTPLMEAVSASAGSAVVNMLLAAGADVNTTDQDGMTPLLLAARDSRVADTVLVLMNAGADPTARTPAGETAAGLAAGNPAVNSTRLLPRLSELQEFPFDPAWPTGYVVPVEGATISSRASHLPGALRAYRNGRHEGFDFYQGTVSVAISYGTPIVAVAAGTVIRADHGYAELTVEEYDQIIAESQAALGTPPDALDRLRGRQVWIEHPGGFISRYAHLASIEPAIQEGTAVSQNQVIAATGNSGTVEAATGTQDDPHPHVEIWQGDDVYLGSGLEPEQIYLLAEQVFGAAAMPPFTD